MDEAKAAAYYDELAKKGGGAAKFKQGLGFSSSSKSTSQSESSSSDPTKKSSFYANFIPASSTAVIAPPQPLNSDQTLSRRCIDEIRDKLKKKQGAIDDKKDNRDYDDDNHRHHDHRSNRDRQTREYSRHRSPRRESYRRSVDEEGRRTRSTRNMESRCNPSDDDERKSPRRSRGGDQCERPSHGSRRRSPFSINRSSGRKSDSSRREGEQSKCRDAVDYSRLIDGYSGMVVMNDNGEAKMAVTGGNVDALTNFTPAEKVKAKMEFQLSKTATEDAALGVNTRWERFDFNKEAPLEEEDEEIEVAEDDSLIGNMGKTFRFSAVEVKREDRIRDAHEQAMFGTPAALPALPENEVVEQNNATEATNSPLLSDKVVATQQGSWRDRVRQVKK